MKLSKSYSRFLPQFMALLLAALMAGCGSGGQDPILGVGANTNVVGLACIPGPSTAKAITTYSISGSAGVINEPAKTIAVTMPSGTAVTALAATFTTTGTGVTVGGVAQTSGTTANDFTAPVDYTVTAGDCSTVVYTVTVSVTVLPLASCGGPGPVDMGAAASFGVLVGPAGGATLTNNGLATTVNGDVGAASIVTAPTVGAGFTVFTGVDAPYVAAKADMLTAIGCAAGRGCDFNYGAATDFATVAGLAPGVHCVTGAMSVGSNMTLSTPGVYIFRSTGNLTSANTITLAFGGTANASNTSVFWVPTGFASLGTDNAFIGTIMPDASAATTLGANTTLLPGRAFSNSDVTLSTNTITKPTP